jgi:hypothetical protein
VLLVDHDQPQLAERQEERRARADDEPRRALGDRAPGPPPGRLGDAGVPFRRRGAEPRLDAGHELAGERDLGQEHQRLPAGPHRLRDRLEIDLRLAGPGDPLQERRAVAPGAYDLAQSARRLGLRRGQRPRRRLGIERRKRRVPWRRLAADHALCLEALYDAAGDTREVGELARRKAEVAIVLERLEHPRPRRGHPVGPRFSEPQERPRRRRVGQRRHPCGEPQHHRERRQRVVRRPGKEVTHRRAQRRQVEHAGDVAQLLRRHVAGAGPPDAAEYPTRPERHLDELAGADAALGRAVVQHPVEHLRHHHRDGRASREGGRFGVAHWQIDVFHRATPWASIPRNHKA